MLLIIMLSLSLFPLIHDASPPVVSMDILKSSTIRLVVSVDFSKAKYSSTLTRFHICCSLFNVVRMNEIIRTGASLDSVGNNHSILVFAKTTGSIEVNPRIEVTL